MKKILTLCCALLGMSTTMNAEDQTIFLGPSATNTWTGFNNYDLELVYPCTIQGVLNYGGADVLLADATGATSFLITSSVQIITLKLSKLENSFLKVVYNDASNTESYNYSVDNETYTVTIPASTDELLPPGATKFSFMIGLSNGDATSEVTIDELPLLDSSEMILEVENVWWCPAVSSATFFDKTGSISEYSVFFYVDEDVYLTEDTKIEIEIEDACIELQTTGFWVDYTADGKSGSMGVACPTGGEGTATIDLGNAAEKALVGVTKISGLSFKLYNLSNLEAGTKVCTIKSVTLKDAGEIPTAISSVVSDADAIEVARYNVVGQKLSGEQKGINIIVYSDGSSKKVLVK